MSDLSEREKRSTKSGEDDGGGAIYCGIAALVWLITFALCWIYAIDEYGFMLGVSFGWFPSAIVAFIAAFLWPLLVLGIGALLIFVK